MENLNKDMPLTPAVFYILMALVNGEKHGYEIMKQVKADSLDQVKMGTGTLYGTLKRLLALEMIEETQQEVVKNKTRLYYRITEKGLGIFNAEVSRYKRVIDLTKKLNLNPQIIGYSL